MEQEIELIVSCHGVFTSLVGVFIVLEALVQIGLAFGVVERVRGLVLLGNGRIDLLYLSAQLLRWYTLAGVVMVESGQLVAQ